MNYNNSCSIDMKVSYICQNEYNYFLNKKGVVGVALGYKITKGFSTFKKCITVFVEKKLSPNNLTKENIIPKCYKGIITDVVENGIFSFNSLNQRIRPVLNGYSIGNILDNTCGSCGCLVADKYLYILSNNHILALNNTAPLESVILQPGVDDGGTRKKDVIGYLARFVPIKFTERGQRPENEVDCALCKVISRSFVSPSIALVGILQGTAKANLNDDVKKVGRTTELNYGKVTHLYGTVTVTEPSTQKEAVFKNQIITNVLQESGDSGSLLLNNNNYAIGLNMCGGIQLSAANDIDTVLKSLKVNLVTKISVNCTNSCSIDMNIEENKDFLYK